MSEAKETKNQASESWADIPVELIKTINQSLVDKGHQSVCFDRFLFLNNVGGKRISQNVLALVFATSRVAANRITQREPNVAMACSTFSVDDDANSIGIFFENAKSEERTVTIRNLQKIVDYANNILEAFDQPKIPNFTLQNNK